MEFDSLRNRVHEDAKHPCVVVKCTTYFSEGLYGPFRAVALFTRRSLLECGKGEVEFPLSLSPVDLASNEIEWAILAHAPAYSKGNRSCDLCLTQKLYISKNSQNPQYLNKRSELAQKCRHRHRHLLQPPARKGQAEEAE